MRGEAPDWISDFVGEVVNGSVFDGIDSDADVTVIKESGKDGAYVASTVDAFDHIEDEYRT
jgi:hypothetical protein